MDPRSVLIETRRTWRPPFELQHSCPREVRLKAAGRALLVIAVVFIFGAPPAGALLLVKATTDRAERRELIANGQDGMATVTKRWIKKGDHPSYLVEYHYGAPDRRLAGRISVSSSSWNRLEPGFELPVRFLPRDPQRHLVPGHEEQLIPLWIPYLVAAAAGILGWLLTLPLRFQKRLLTDGRPAPAVVMAHRKVQHQTVLRYKFMTLSGSIEEGKSEARRNPPPVGSIVCVLYERDNAGNNRAYPFPLYKREI